MGVRSDYSLLINQILGYLLVYGPTVNTILELSTVIVNLLHLIILFQKPLRSSSIFILMIGICLSDILAFLTLFLFIGEDRVSWYRSLLSTLRYSGFEMTLCLPPGYKSLSLIGLTKVLILNSSRPISIWLAIQMAFLRTLSIVFPMNETQSVYSGYSIIHGNSFL
uniref:G_PROTEIN_RECEP_F1_2 domain-containing protein n=1 Tax=Caenorhabditis tropicalis TaxID=1561998 RepID=A0A1I7UE45_9PELO